MTSMRSGAAPDESQPLAPCLVLVTGHAAAGKSTLAPRLAEALGAIWISRDIIHSTVYSGWRPQHPALTSPGRYDPEVDGNVYFEGGVVWELFLWMLTTVAPHHPVVADTPFNHLWNREMFDRARPKIPVPLVEVALHGDSEALLLRARRRAEQPGVHEIKARFSVRPELYRADYQPVLPADQVVRVDSTNLDLVDLEGVATEVRRKLPRQPRAAR
ncbi:MAG TPA: AAA family ATPase [Microlunatus sp.]